MRSPILLATAAGFLACSAAPTAETAKHNFVLHEKRDGAPHQWTRRNRAHPAEILPVRIGLLQSNLHKAEEYILDVSDPYSPNFGTYHPSSFYFLVFTQYSNVLEMIGKHWSAEKVANTFAPAKKTQDGVADWLVEFGIDAERHTYSTGTYRLLTSAGFM
jgi:tripeptidyl-peptidase I